MIACIQGGLCAEIVALQDGTPVRMRMNRTLSSADAQVDDKLDLEVLDEVRIGSLVVIPRGSTAMATVTEARSRRNMGRAGHLNVNIDYVRDATGAKIPLRGVQNAKAGGHVGAMTGAMVATSIVFFPAAPLFLFVKGKDITIPKGHELTVYTNGDTKLDAAKYGAVGADAGSTKPVTRNSGKPITNLDVLGLKEAGFSDDLIVTKIKSSPADFTLDTENLISLHKAGVSDAVIAAMMQSPK